MDYLKHLSASGQLWVPLGKKGHTAINHLKNKTEKEKKKKFS